MHASPWSQLSCIVGDVSHMKRGIANLIGPIDLGSAAAFALPEIDKHDIDVPDIKGKNSFQKSWMMLSLL